mgnify:CR=1 FL=1|jgi:hypothetical protein|tara:strand:+ start:2435 stop:2614 length:180 start_codon:yes stop_codon:yes gene_type:complete
MKKDIYKQIKEADDNCQEMIRNLKECVAILGRIEILVSGLEYEKEMVNAKKERKNETYK